MEMDRAAPLCRVHHAWVGGSDASEMYLPVRLREIQSLLVSSDSALNSIDRSFHQSMSILSLSCPEHILIRLPVLRTRILRALRNMLCLHR